MADHRALVIADTAAALLKAAAGGYGVEVERWHEIEPDECPFISVELGPDLAVSEFGTDAVNHIDSTLTLYVDIYESVANRNAVRSVMAARALVHQTLLPDLNADLGLSWVGGFRYAGAEEVDREPENSKQTVMLRTVWQAHYRTSFTDPTT